VKDRFGVATVAAADLRFWKRTRFLAMNFLTYSPTAIVHLQATGAEVTLIDVRSPAEFSEVHALGARNLPLGDLSPAALAALGCGNHASTVYLICLSGKRAGAAAEKLSGYGYAQPVVITGGTEAWVAAGLWICSPHG
jgi:rhodanese-related sulfurtransferase